MPHEDGPSYFPFVAIISTGADSVVTFKPHRKLLQNDLFSSEMKPESVSGEAQQQASLANLSFQLKRRSLLLFTGDAYTKYLHSIGNVEHGKRVSLTIRQVSLL